MSDVYENAYVGVDPATVWQSPPINTPAEIEKYKQQGLVPVDSLGELVEQVEDEVAEPAVEADAESADSDADAPPADPDAEADPNADAPPVNPDDEQIVTQPLL